MKYKRQIVEAFFRGVGLPEVAFEFRILEDRLYRWDIAFPGRGLAIEVQGGIWTGGAHARGAGIARDMEKHNLATVAGWRVLYVEPKNLLTYEFVRRIQAALRA